MWFQAIKVSSEDKNNQSKTSFLVVEKKSEVYLMDWLFASFRHRVIWFRPLELMEAQLSYNVTLCRSNYGKRIIIAVHSYEIPNFLLHDSYFASSWNYPLCS